MNNFKSVSILFPLYKDKKTVKKMILKSNKLLKKMKKKSEIVIVDDGCPEKSGHYARIISKKIKNVKVIFHKKNMGYGAAIKTGLKNCRNEWIFQTDGDAEYDVNDLLKLIKKTKVSDLIVTYRLKKKYKTSRIVISWIYNVILRILFHTKFKDISTGSRLINKKILKKINLISNSPFLGAELAIKSKYKGFKVSEVGIHTYPRTFGSGSSVSFKNILLTIKEMLLLFIKIKI
ncbi:glycosyltransferase family 2 protein [Pelagibacteraceae bacterium]|jgi:glycosyltransferase involved in cell wall biosynthesis|nr:glycosyltransferase family 2 protein [Pelagibacteraceae bacterium]MDC1130442.1 glycosyltransferase family 2 protein [Pelagibacteraceae bacterium]